MTINRNSGFDRVVLLSPAKRAVLAWRLRERSQPSATARKSLVAYWTGTATEQELKEFLLQRLPEYMQPNMLMALSKLPRTAAGKVDYAALPSPEVQHTPQQADGQDESHPVYQTLCGIWKEVLRVAVVQPGDNFFGLGGDSILGLQLVSRGRREGLQLAPRDIFAFATLAELAAAVSDRASKAKPGAVQAEAGQTGETAHSRDKEITPVAPQGSDQLTPIEHWFFALDFAAKQHWNMPMLLAVRKGVDADLLEQALLQVTARHAELCCSFRQQGAAWQTATPASQACAFERYDFSDLPADESISARTAAIQTLQRSLDLQCGRLFRSAYLRCSGEPDVLLLLAHHLCVDGVTWRCLLDELEEAYTALQEGREARFNTVAVSYAEWAEALSVATQQHAFEQERNYWLGQKTTTPVVFSVDFPAAENLEGDAVALRASLTPEETTALLQNAHLAYQTNVEDLLIAALSASVLPWARVDELSVTLERHGRDAAVVDCDISAAIGWFTAIFPFRITREGDLPAQLLRATKERLRQVPNGGVGYGALRYLDTKTEEGDALADQITPQLAFNYFGQIDAMAANTLFDGMVEGALSSARSPAAPRAAVFEVQAMVADSTMYIHWIYSSKLHSESTARKLLDSYMQALRELLAHCLTPGSGSYTPSDFPKAELDQDDLDDLLEGLD